MNLLTKKTLLIGLGAVIGSGLGYLYYSQVGCEGGCLIWSSPLNSMAYGALMGGLVLNLVNPANPLTGSKS